MVTLAANRQAVGCAPGVYAAAFTKEGPVLIFTRRIGEFIRIGDDIRVQVIEVKGRQVRLGIEAPPHISVHREEVYLRIKGLPPPPAKMSPVDQVDSEKNSSSPPENATT